MLAEAGESERITRCSTGRLAPPVSIQGVSWLEMSTPLQMNCCSFEGEQ